MYLARADAHAQYGGQDGHIYQGDLFETLSFMIPLRDGSWDERQWDGIVVSHDCEYTKIASSPSKPLLVAPVRPMADYQQRAAILAGDAYALWALSVAEPVRDEYVVDLRLTQPIAVGRLQGGTHWTCLNPDARVEFQAMIARFLFRGVFEGGST